MAYVLGKDAKLFYGDAGAQAATLLSKVKDVKISFSKEEIDATTRASGGWKEYVAGLKDGSIEFDMLYDLADTDCLELASKFLSNEPIALFASDGVGKGFDADFQIFEFGSDQPLNDLSWIHVVAKPTPSTRTPIYKTTASAGV